MLRCFVAVEVAAPHLRRALEGAQLGLRRTFGHPDPVKWVPAHQFHFTLKFLGETPPEAADRAVQALGRAVAGVAPFDVRVAGLGGFPGGEQLSVLWAGVAEGKEQLTALASAVEREFEAAGFPRERRPFRPHLTLGRVRRAKQIRCSTVNEFSRANGEAAERKSARVPAAVPQMLAQAAGQEFGTWRVERVVLMQSELTPGGPIYSVYGFVPLREEKA
ncbi:MAG TPA: RNA 2',3'-cyclic phosphodiesterase [Symbiobacteriaceae bacterium]|nr:RNA 2',3'-cyclic phosphodiesterase [Symbiobacteriaceae bacterium]